MEMLIAFVLVVLEKEQKKGFGGQRGLQSNIIISRKILFPRTSNGLRLRQRRFRKAELEVAELEIEVRGRMSWKRFTNMPRNCTTPYPQ